ncbi:MAG TPA: DUF6454 family protein [Vicinamibacterales bacterium]|jgi:uncharacterized protein DUF6454|nr:DUF6454 family protein [Vicinamibacterales bacterium]
MVSKSLCLWVAVVALIALQGDQRSVVAERAMKLTRDAVWKPVTSIAVGFPTYHPQGMVKIGDTFYVTSVEIKVPTTRFPKPVDGYDRDPGQGIGHLFKIDRTGKLLADLPLGEGTMYHPGGIDYDGTNIWIPVAEYRPDSRSIIYRVDPARMQAAEALRFADHIGAIVHNTDDNTLHGVSWGSRRFYRWTLDTQGKVTNADVPPDKLRVMNLSHYVDYQDCKYAGGRRMLCSGVTELRQRPDAPPFRLGGLELIDLSGGRPLHQVPVLLWTADGVDMMHNPVWIEPSATGLRGYFMPEDNTSTIYIYDVDVK